MSDDIPRHHRKRKSHRERRWEIEYWNYFQQAWRHHRWYESRKQRDQALADLTKSRCLIGMVLPKIKYRAVDR